jgi:hypothetical protein
MRELLIHSVRFLFTLHTSYDGSFQLSRKNKPSDAWDSCLTDGRMYFARESPFKTFFQDSVRSGNRISTKVPVQRYPHEHDNSVSLNKDAACNNHQAAETGWVKFGGLSETGIGSVICARHSFFMPEGTVNFTTGERYARGKLYLNC